MTDVVAETPHGSLRGHGSGPTCAFLGIRYAKPPTGGLRFLPPVPQPWVHGPVDARIPGSAPAQILRPSPPWLRARAPLRTGEDCLNLNIWTPDVDGHRRPVLVHAFGGGFQSGSGSDGFQDGAALAARGDVIVVRLNFRVGALGFLHLGGAWGAPYEAGNVGLLDLCAALQWVQENVSSLGGDPDNVTVFGLSSGAFMIASLFGVPASRGLFHRAWMQSGSASRIIDRAVAADQACEFLRIAGVDVGDKAALSRVDVADLLAAQERIVALDLGERNAPGGRTLGVVDDGVTLTEHPLAVLGRGDRRDIPLVLGTTRDEARLWFATGAMRTPQSMDDVLGEMARFAGAGRAAALFDHYLSAYPGSNPAEIRERFLGDAVYRVPALRTALAHAKAGGTALTYRFDWPSPYDSGALGASHGFDEPFVWGVANPDLVPYIGNDPEAAGLAGAMSDALIRFARTGDPGWPSCIQSAPTTRLFGGSGPVSAQVDGEMLAAWKGIERR